MAESYDVVVVGAGPAGSVAARAAAEADVSVLLLERRSAIGVPVRCGEFLPVPTEISDLLPHSSRAARLCDVPRQYITNMCNRLRLVSPRGASFEFSMRANVLDRAGFDQHLVRLAEQAGAVVQLGSTVLSCHRDGTLLVRQGGDNSSIRGRVVIGADGPFSTVARCLQPYQLPDAASLAYAIQYVMRDVECDPHVTQMYFGGVAPGGYAWIIPKGDGMANVGLGIRRLTGSADRPLRSYLDHFIKRYPFSSSQFRHAEVVQRVSKAIPVGGPRERTYGDRVLLVGDAAGHVMASNGGGIPTAMVAGEIAGMVAAAHIRQSTPLSEYELAWRREMGITLYGALTVLRVATPVMVSDALTHVGMMLAGRPLLEQCIRCRCITPSLTPLAIKALRLLSPCSHL